MESNNNGIVSNVLWKFAERILAQVVSLIVSIVLARLLLPEDYGAIAMVTVVITIADVFVTNGIPTALIQKKNADTEDFSSVFYFNLLLSIAIYIVIFAIAPFVASFYSMPILSSVLRVMGTRIIISAVNSVQHAYVSRHMMFKKYFLSTLFGTLVSGVVGIAMAYSGFGVWALVAQYMTNTTIDTIVLFITVKWRPTLFYSWKRVKELVQFGWKVLFEGVSNTVYEQLQSLIIGRVYTSSDLGYYSKAQQFPNVLVVNISAAISSVLFPAISNIQDDNDRVLEILRKSVRLSCFVLVPLLTGLAAVATPFISVILTDKWLECVPYLQIYCLINIGGAILIPRHQALLGVGRSDVFMNEHIVARVIQIILLVLVYKKSVFAIAICTLIGSVLMVFIVFYTSKRFNGYLYSMQIRDFVPSAIGSLLMFCIVYPLTFLNTSSLLKLIVQVIVGFAVYYFYSIKFNSEGIAFVKRYIRRFVHRREL